MARPLRVPPEIAHEERPARSTASVTDLLRSLIDEAGELVRTEANVIKLEVQESTRAMLRESVKAMIYGGVALLGVLSLMAFLIIGLGDLLSEGTRATSYWVSALIIGVLFAGIGGYMAMRHGRQIGSEVGLPKSQSELRTDRQFVRRELDKIKEAARP